MMPDEFFKKNMEMWESFSTNYMDNMFKMVEKTMEQSQVLKDRVDQAVSEALGKQLDATLTGLQALQKQVEALSEKVDQLSEKE